jgi:putative PIN family toxin of toxin-antitoxin system
MQKVVVDTNVLVSALIQKSYPYYIINHFIVEHKFEWCISDVLFQEYYEVLNRRKFSRYPDFVIKAESLLAFIEEKSTVFVPKKKLHVISDVEDNKLLELAVESRAGFLITGNTNDFTMDHYKRTQIVSPKEYWKNYCPQ